MKRGLLKVKLIPVARMRVDYDTWVAAVAQALEEFGADDRAKVFSGNTQRVYRINATDAALQRAG